MIENSSATEQIVNFAANLSIDELPEEVIEKAKLTVLDAIGCAYGGSSSEIGRTAIEALTQEANGKNIVIGSSLKASDIAASFINSTLINALDYDDDNGVGHPTASILPPMLVAACDKEISGAKFLSSFIAAQESSIRIGRSIWPTEKRYLEVWGVGTHQVFGAAIGAGLVSNLNNRQLSSAFGIAGTGAPVPSAMKWGWDSGPISWMKDTVAWSAIAGTISVYLAKAGFEGCHDILDGRHGFWVMASSDRFDPTEITCELGHTFRFLDMAIKPYPCCRYAHSTIDAILEITSGQTFLSNEIDKINIYSVSDLASYMNRPRPESLVEAQFSMPFLAAVSIAKGGLNPANMGDQRILEDSEILKISQKVYVTADPEADRIYNATHSEIRTRVEFIFTDGRKQTATVCFPRGERVNPIQRDDVLEKFDQMASPRLGSRGAFDLRNHIMRLETVPAVKSLLAMLGG